MNILISGVNGFLGSALAKKLKLAGHNIFGLIRSYASTAKINKYISPKNLFLLEELESLFKKQKINAVINAAVEYDRDSQRPFQAFYTNEMLPIKLLQFAIENNVAKFVNFDTFYDLNNCPTNMFSYTLSKKNCISRTRYIVSANPVLNYYNIKLANVYGPDDSLDKLVSVFINKCMKNLPIDLINPYETRDYIFISDVVNAIECVINATSDVGYIDFDIGSGSSITNLQLANIIKEISNSKSCIGFSHNVNLNNLYYKEFDLSYIESMGWSAQTHLSDGLKQCVDFYRD